MWYRLRNDFTLAIITLLGLCGALGVAPFAVYRFATGELLAGVINCTITLAIVGATLYAWRTGKTRVAAWLSAGATTVGCLAVATLFGLPGLFWMYASVLANFLLLRPLEAVVLVAVALSSLVIHGAAFSSTLQMMMFMVSISVVSLFSFSFAYRTDHQRLQLQALALRDPLTGAANRRSMEDELQVAIDTTQRERRSFGIAILDLDHFKRINDRHGHAAGDQVLVEFVDLLRSLTRKVDRLFRYGGEEFVLLFPDADEVALQTITEKLRACTSETLHSRGEAVTVSIGGAALRSDESWQAWLERADAALYQAKNEGRNRTVISDGAEAIVDADPDSPEVSCSR